MIVARLLTPPLFLNLYHVPFAPLIPNIQHHPHHTNNALIIISAWITQARLICGKYVDPI